MDYEVMWNELKEFINDKYEKEHDDIPKYIYDIVCNKMNNMEFRNRNITENGDYICIKNHSSVFTEGTECSMITEDEDYYVIENINDGYAIDINKSVFDKYFKCIRE